MRFVAAASILALMALTTWSFAVAPAHGWWMPHNVSSYGGEIDRLFMAILWVVAFFFLLTEGLLVWFVLRGARARPGKALFSHGNVRLEIVWTIVPGAILVALALAQLSTWNTIQSARDTHAVPLAEAWAAQFEWRFLYPGDDGRFGTADDFENPYELVAPVDEPVTLALRSRDVIHSFFVPNFRLKQDVLPGSTLSTWFEAREIGEYDLVCTQLCGFGHYNMAGRIKIVSRADYDAWVVVQKRTWLSNGQDERP